MAEKIGVGTEVTELKLGRSFTKNGSMGFHSVRYDFKPASVDPTQVAKVDIGGNNQVRVTVPHIEGSGKSETVFQGSKKPYQKECVLIIDHITGEITLEKLSYNIQLKKTRSEGGSKKYAQQRPVTPVDYPSHKASSLSLKSSPSQRLAPSPNDVSRISPNRNASPAQKSPSNLSSPLQSSQCSPSMPILVPPSSSLTTHTPVSAPVPASYRHRKPTSPVKSSMPTFSQLVNDSQASCEDVGILSDSSSSSNSDGSSDSESEIVQNSTYASDSGMKNVQVIGKQSSSPLPSMPQLSQLSEDLQLSESDSD